MTLLLNRKCGLQIRWFIVTPNDVLFAKSIHMSSLGQHFIHLCFDSTEYGDGGNKSKTITAAYCCSHRGTVFKRKHITYWTNLLILFCWLEC